MADILKEYSEATVAGAGQLKLIIMLYEGAERFLRQARGNIERNEIEKAHINLTKAKRIVAHFLGTNNPESGELGMNLHRLYLFLYEKIATANLQKSVEEADDALRILRKLLEGWRDLQQQEAPAPTAAPPGQPSRAISLQA